MGLKLNLPSLGCPATSVNLRKDVSPQIADQVAVPKMNRTGFLLDACRSGGQIPDASANPIANSPYAGINKLGFCP